MNLFNLMATISLDDSKYQRGINKAEKSTMSLGSTIKKLAIGGAVAGIGKASITMGMDFEAGMSQVAATMGLTAEEIKNGDESFKALEKAAKEAGSTTQFSATQSAEALNYLALSGKDAEESIQLLPKVLNLAASGGMELGRATDMVTDSMSALGLETSQADKFMDEMAKTSQKSNTTVSQLGDAILTVGGTAKVLAGGTVEMNTQLGILADNGIKGAEGGTALRNIILSLSAPTDKAAESIKKLGVDVFDSSGKMRETNVIFAEMDKALGKLTQEEKTQALNNIFNKVDLKSVNALLDNSGDRFNNLSKEIENSKDAAKNMAETMNANLKGALTELKSATEGVAIALYGKFSDGLEAGVRKLSKFTQEVAKIIDESESLSDAIPKIMQLVTKGVTDTIVYLVSNTPKFLAIGMKFIYAIIKGVALSIPTLIAEFTKSIPKMLKSFVEGIPQFIAQGTKLILAITSGVAIALPTFITLAPKIIEFFAKAMITRMSMIMSVASTIIPAMVQGIVALLPTLLQKAVDIMNGISQKIIEKLPSMLENGLKIAISIITGIFAAIPMFIDTAVNIIETLLNTFSQLFPDILETGTKILNKIIEGLINTLPKLIEATFKIISKFVGTIMENLPAILEKGKEMLLKLVQGITNKLPDIVNAISKGIRMFVETVIKNLPQIVKTGVKIIIELVAGLVKALPKLFKEGARLIKELVSIMMDNMPGFLEVGKAVVSGVWNGIKSMGSWFKSKIGDFFGGMINGVKSLFGIHSPSRVFRDEVGKWIPAGVAVGIEDNMKPLEDTLDRELGATIDIAKPNVPKIGHNKQENVKIELRIDNFYNNSKEDIQHIADELAYMIERKRYAAGGR